ncbi:hypothetical protein LXL04_029536 [Taraxacum kok-saghyz]
MDRKNHELHPVCWDQVGVSNPYNYNKDLKDTSPNAGGSGLAIPLAIPLAEDSPKSPNHTGSPRLRLRCRQPALPCRNLSELAEELNDSILHTTTAIYCSSLLILKFPLVDMVGGFFGVGESNRTRRRTMRDILFIAGSTITSARPTFRSITANPSEISFEVFTYQTDFSKSFHLWLINRSPNQRQPNRSPKPSSLIQSTATVPEA